MTKSPLAHRHYAGADAKMLSFCSVIHSQFQENIADFTAFDANLDAAFAISFANAINDAWHFGTNYQHVYATAQDTKDLAKKMIEARDMFQMQKYFIKKAFANNPGIWNEFGFNTYKAARINTEKMIQFITDLHQTTLKYETELAAAGFGPTHIAALFTLKNELQALTTAQQQSKGQRYTATYQRIELLNRAYDMCSTICKVAKILYATQYGRYHSFIAHHHKKKTAVMAPEI